MDKYSHETLENDEKLRFLEENLLFIHKKYLEIPENRRITYNTFRNYVPKYYKYATKKSDMCGICEFG